MKRIIILLAMMGHASAQYIEAPAPMNQVYNPAKMKNIATAYAIFCAKGWLWGQNCVERKMEILGQACDPNLIRHLVPDGGYAGGKLSADYKYVGYKCFYANPEDAKTNQYGTEGTAEEWPDMPPLPKWTSDPKVVARIEEKPVSGLTLFNGTGPDATTQIKSVMPRVCNVMNERGRPIQSWWADEDGSCNIYDNPHK